MTNYILGMMVFEHVIRYGRMERIVQMINAIGLTIEFLISVLR